MTIYDFLFDPANEHGRQTMAQYDPTKVWFGPADREHEYEQVIDRDSLTHRSASFELPHHLDATAVVLSELFWPDKLIDRFRACTNAYAKDHCAASVYRPVTNGEILAFMAAVTYMGVVKLPSKDDYFPSENFDVLPSHPSIKLSRWRFRYLWSNFHTSYKLGQDNAATPSRNESRRDDEFDIDVEDGAVDDEPIVVDRLSPDYEFTPYADFDDMEEEQRDTTEESRWYESVKFIIDHVNEISQMLCKAPGLILSIDEILRRFFGRSAQTERMHRKPDKEGYKFYAMCDKDTGYVYAFFPTGRLQKTKIHEQVVRLATTLPRRNDLDYVICMDNYFTRPKTMIELGALEIGVVGTARRQSNWRPFSYIKDKDTRFNTWYTRHDKNNYLVCRWIDNTEVLFVSNIHNGLGIVEKERKRPRETAFNRKHVRAIFGSEGKKVIDIPEIVHDYNNWMYGVDLADQLISYYKPNLRCRRTWMPLWLQSMDIARTNAYIISRKKGKASSHKRFVLDWIKALNGRAEASTYRVTRNAVSTPTPNKQKRKRDRMSHIKPSLPSKRLEGDPSLHRECGGLSQLSCRMCCFLHAKSKITEGATEYKIRKSTKACEYCDVRLCKKHFDIYHSVDAESTSLSS